MRKKVAAFLVAGVALAACGGSGDSSSDTSAAAAGGRVKNVALTTVPAAATDLWSKSCADGGGCRLGDKGPGGGIVFYSGKNVINKVDGVSNGGVYMEFLDVSDEYGWASEGKKPWVSWGCGKPAVEILSTREPSKDAAGNPIYSDSVGKGAQNSKDIVTLCTTPDIAADQALDSTKGGKDDWFLPSTGEMNQLCWFVRGQVKDHTTKCDANVPTVRTDVSLNERFWTSTEGNYEYAGTFDLGSVYTGGVKKNGTESLGLVRAFGVYAGEPPATTTTTVPPTCEKGGLCKVGDTGPGGGTVFYVGTSKIGSYGTKYPGGKYLEFIDPNPSKTFKFKCAIHVHDLKSGIGAGAENTARYRAVCSDSDSPVLLASNATNGGKSDWFIPSMEDLNQICRYSRGQTTGSTEQCNGKSKIVVSGNSFNEAQWSSDQFSQQSMYARSFGDGTSVKRDKNKYSYKFFLVRAFG